MFRGLCRIKRGIYMFARFVTMTALIFPIITGCTVDSGKEQFDTAQFEEKQGNREHAAKLYQEIVQKHAGSELAKKAEARLIEINKPR